MFSIETLKNDIIVMMTKRFDAALQILVIVTIQYYLNIVVTLI